MLSFDIVKPSLIIDKAKALENIQHMQAKAAYHAAIFRPHFKTHQSGVVGEWFRQAGVDKISVSSVNMAQYFADHGWDDILIAFPVNLLEIKQINRLASRVDLQLLLEDTTVASRLDDLLEHPVGIYIKLDVGAHRTGIPMENERKILELAKAIAKLDKLRLNGLLAHAGQFYHNPGGITAIQEEVSAISKQLSWLEQRIGDENLLLSWGDTPSCSMLESLPDFDEWRPGNFVYYDLMQYHIGACQLNDIAVAVACPVVAIHPERNEMLVYGGAVHFSKEFIAADQNFRLYGYLVNFTGKGWSDPIPGAWLSGLSQEHGTVKLPAGFAQQFKPGDVVGILPVHSCLTVDAIGIQYTTEGELVSKMNFA
ncbi:MAG: alanine racemase [Bacteroidales bacterium]|jgi:D-serine deaminase-like pyridoxal phosphate-dependent protein|nr:alanine racemase [Bacteroidales bacterium]